ncbi:MAG: hypothetical protein PHU23_17170 [Dehalococcoidales bacterium]|nr:hypothetical protein [Dehalococcoidales bacterium]
MQNTKMNDKVFERSLTTLTVISVAWILAGIILPIIGIPWIAAGWATFIGLMMLILGGGTLLYFWGKNYMSRG